MSHVVNLCLGLATLIIDTLGPTSALIVAAFADNRDPTAELTEVIASQHGRLVATLAFLRASRAADTLRSMRDSGDLEILTEVQLAYVLYALAMHTLRSVALPETPVRVTS